MRQQSIIYTVQVIFIKMLAEQCPVHAVKVDQRSSFAKWSHHNVYTSLDTLANPIGKIEQSAMC